MTAQPSHPTPTNDHGRLTVTIYNEDTGGPAETVEAGPGEKVAKVIDEYYALIGASPQPGDRFFCRPNDESLDVYREWHLRDLAAGPCPDLVWTFAHDTGGASL